MKALMSYTSSVLEWLGRYVGLLAIICDCFVHSHDHDDGIL